MLLGTTCEADFRTLCDLCCIPDRGLAWIDIIYFAATSIGSNGDCEGRSVIAANLGEIRIFMASSTYRLQNHGQEKWGTVKNRTDTKPVANEKYTNTKESGKNHPLGAVSNTNQGINLLTNSSSVIPCAFPMYSQKSLFLMNRNELEYQHHQMLSAHNTNR